MNMSKLVRRPKSAASVVKRREFVWIRDEGVRSKISMSRLMLPVK